MSEKIHTLEETPARRARPKTTRRAVKHTALVGSVAMLMGMTLMATMSGDSLASWVAVEHVSAEFKTDPMLTATATTGATSPIAISLDWSVPNARGDERFIVERATSSNGENTVLVADELTTMSYVDRGNIPVSQNGCAVGSVLLTSTTCSLVQEEDYWYRVSYRLGGSTSESSSWVKATTAARESLATQANPNGTTKTQIALQWDAAPYAELSASTYLLERATGAEGTDASVIYDGSARAANDTTGTPATEQPYSTASSNVSSCVLGVSGSVSCWGTISGTKYTSAKPKVFVPGNVMGSRAVKLVAQQTGTSNLSDRDGGYCAVGENGKAIACWLGVWSGDNQGGINRPTSPKLIPNVSAITDASGAVTHMAMAQETRCFATAQNKVYCWGAGWQGALGDGLAYYYDTNPVGSGKIGSQDSPDASRPVLLSGVISSNSNITKLVAGKHFFCALTDRGEVACWGNTTFDGVQYISASENRPWLLVSAATGILGGQKVADIQAGGANLCALTESGTMACWGDNAGGQLGTGTKDNDSVPFIAAGNQPVQATMAPTNVREMYLGGGVIAALLGPSRSAGWTCAVTKTEKLLCWGANHKGQIGNGTSSTNERVLAPYTVFDGSFGTVKSVSLGNQHVCAQAGSHVYCWGSNTYGQVGASGTFQVPRNTGLVMEIGCAFGATVISGSRCSLAPGTTYYYRLTYDLNGLVVTGDWMPHRTNSS